MLGMTRTTNSFRETKNDDGKKAIKSERHEVRDLREHFAERRGHGRGGGTLSRLASGFA